MSGGWALEQLVRPEILRLQPYESARLRATEGVLLDANELPEDGPGSPPGLNRYPDPRQSELRARLAGRLGVGADQVLAGAGSDEVIDWLFKVFCRPGRDRVAILEPTYGMYRVMADVYGVGVDDHRLADGFQLHASDLLGTLAEDVKIVFLCSPNNPTGNVLNPAEVRRLLDGFAGVVVVDEAYIEFAAAESLVSQIGLHPNLIVMRTLSKAWGLAGLRLGYAVASAAIIACFEKVKAPYNLGAAAQQEASRCLADGDSLDAAVRRIRDARQRLAESLKAVSGVREVLPSEANFLLFRCAEPTRVCGELFARGVIVRDRSALPGLRGWVRVSVGTEDDNRRFLAVLREVLS